MCTGIDSRESENSVVSPELLGKSMFQTAIVMFPRILDVSRTWFFRQADAVRMCSAILVGISGFLSAYSRLVAAPKACSANDWD